MVSGKEKSSQKQPPVGASLPDIDILKRTLLPRYIGGEDFSPDEKKKLGDALRDVASKIEKGETSPTALEQEAANNLLKRFTTEKKLLVVERQPIRTLLLHIVEKDKENRSITPVEDAAIRSILDRYGQLKALSEDEKDVLNNMQKNTWAKIQSQTEEKEKRIDLSRLDHKGLNALMLRYGAGRTLFDMEGRLIDVCLTSTVNTMIRKPTKTLSEHQDKAMRQFLKNYSEGAKLSPAQDSSIQKLSKHILKKMGAGQDLNELEAIARDGILPRYIGGRGATHDEGRLRNTIFNTLFEKVKRGDPLTGLESKALDYHLKTYRESETSPTSGEELSKPENKSLQDLLGHINDRIDRYTQEKRAAREAEKERAEGDEEAPEAEEKKEVKLEFTPDEQKVVDALLNRYGDEKKLEGVEKKIRNDLLTIIAVTIRHKEELTPPEEYAIRKYAEKRSEALIKAEVDGKPQKESPLDRIVIDWYNKKLNEETPEDDKIEFE